MSTVVLDTITGKSTATTITIGSTPVVSASANSMTIRGEGSAQTSIQQGLAKSWMQQSSGTTINGSFNCSGLTDNGTGDYTTSFTNDMANDDYACQCTGADANTNASISTLVMNTVGYAAGSARMYLLNDDSGAVDGAPNSITVNGDLA